MLNCSNLNEKMNAVDLEEYLRLKQHIYAAMVKDKLDNISKTATNLHLGGECGCLLNISGAMKHFGNTSIQKHSAEFIWERSTNKEIKIKE